jgi:hypothetical protein
MFFAATLVRNAFGEALKVRAGLALAREGASTPEQTSKQAKFPGRDSRTIAKGTAGREASFDYRVMEGN